MLKQEETRFRTLFVPVSDTPADVVTWMTKDLEAKIVKRNAVVALWPGESDELRMTISQRRKGGDEVSKAMLGAAAFFQQRRLSGEAKLRAERLNQRLFDTCLLIGCISESLLSPRALQAIQHLAAHLVALVFDGWSMREADGRLVLDTKGDLEPGALQPAYAVVTVKEAKVVVPSGVREKLLRLGLRVADKESQSPFRFQRSWERQLEYLSLKHPTPRAVDRAVALKAFFSAAGLTQVHLERSKPDGRVLEGATLLSQERQAVIGDGWAFYDDQGRTILDRNGAGDAGAAVPSVGATAVAEKVAAKSRKKVG